MTMNVYKKHANLSEIKINIDKTCISLSLNVNILENENNYLSILFGDFFVSNLVDECYNLSVSNIFSSRLDIIYHSKKDRQSKIHSWTNNMRNHEHNIQDQYIAKGQNITLIKMHPCFKSLAIPEINTELLGIMKRRSLELAIKLNNINVFFNDNLLAKQNFLDYCKLYTNNNDVFHYSINSNTEFCISLSNDQKFNQISLVNGISTFRGGNHVNYLLDQIVLYFNQILKNMNKTTIPKYGAISQHLFLFVNCNIDNATYQSVSRDYMNLNQFIFKQYLRLDTDFIDKFKNSNIFLSLFEKTKQPSCSKICNVKNFYEANNLGGTLVISVCDNTNLYDFSRDSYGYFRLTGTNFEDLFRVLGSFNNLRYSKILFLLNPSNNLDSYYLGLLIHEIYNRCRNLLKQSFVESISCVNKPMNIERDSVSYEYSELDDVAICSAFSENKNLFNIWFRESNVKYKENEASIQTKTKITFAEYINTHVFRYFLNTRLNQLPSLLDGLTPTEHDLVKFVLSSDSPTISKVLIKFENIYKSIVKLSCEKTNNLNFLLPIKEVNGKFDSNSLVSVNPQMRLYYQEFNHGGLLPIIPMVLINGFRSEHSFIPRFHPIDIVKNLQLLIANKQAVTMKPYYKGFNGNLEIIGDNLFSRGIINESANKYFITELPLFTTREWYIKNILNQMIKVNNKTGVSLIKNYFDKSSLDHTQFIIEMDKDQINQIPLNGGVYKFFSLEKNVKLRMHVYNNNQIINLNTNVADILKDYFNVTKKLYEKNFSNGVETWLEHLESFQNQYIKRVEINLDEFSGYKREYHDNIPNKQQMEFDGTLTFNASNEILEKITANHPISENVYRQIENNYQYKTPPSKKSKQSNTRPTRTNSKVQNTKSGTSSTNSSKKSESTSSKKKTTTQRTNDGEKVSNSENKTASKATKSKTPKAAIKRTVATTPKLSAKNITKNKTPSKKLDFTQSPVSKTPDKTLPDLISPKVTPIQSVVNNRMVSINVDSKLSADQNSLDDKAKKESKSFTTNTTITRNNNSIPLNNVVSSNSNVQKKGTSSNVSTNKSHPNKEVLRESNENIAKTDNKKRNETEDAALYVLGVKRPKLDDKENKPRTLQTNLNDFFRKSK